MPVDRTQLNRERIDALFELLEEEGIGSTEHVAALRKAEAPGEAAEIAQANRNGKAARGRGGQ